MYNNSLASSIANTFHHMVCPCTLDGVCVVCPGTSELVGQQGKQFSFCLQRKQEILLHE